MMGTVTNIRKVAHVPVQTRDGWNLYDFFGGWFSSLGRSKTLLGALVLLLGICLLLPCLLPLITSSASSFIETLVEKKTASHVLAMWDYRN
jgi:hypothetical protein